MMDWIACLFFGTLLLSIVVAFFGVAVLFGIPLVILGVADSIDMTRKHWKKLQKVWNGGAQDE